ncbi:phage regulatory CII family protein [Klebsiella pneumoniae]|uniref:phage regulatory CII family protein n=1 Tax=Klebsiella pneumoniae TaxID=573 RepID=UPI00359C1C08
MFDYQVSKHPHFDEACRAFALRHNLVQLAERAGMNVQILRNKLNPAQPHLLTAPEIWLLTDLTEDSTLVDGFLAQIHCLPCVPINEVAKEKLPHYVMSATAEIGRVAAGAVSGDVKTSAGRRDAISSINSVTRLMALAAVSLQARLQAKEGANKQVISSQADSLIKISRIWADFFPANTSNQPI